MSNIIRRNIKKQTTEQRVTQIGKVQFEMWVKLDAMSKELRKIQDLIGVTDDEAETTDESE